MGGAHSEGAILSVYLGQTDGQLISKVQPIDFNGPV